MQATDRTTDIWDAVIAGQGMAGTTLAWHLREAGLSVLLIDAQEEATSSKIAAGLITPITGQRLTLNWRIDEFLPAARDFYRRIEKLTGASFFHDRVALRLLKEEEVEIWTRKSANPAFAPHLVDPTPPLDPGIAEARHGAFAMHTAQLDMAAYLAASRKFLNCAPLRLDWQRDVEIGGDEISVAGHRTKLLISCEGYAAHQNPYFQWVRFNAAQGDILTLRLQRPMPPITLHRTVWIAPTPDADIFKFGSSYDWDRLDGVPSQSARDDIENKVAQFFRVPYTVIDHQAAVRPIIHQGKAVAGLHPEENKLGFFNGLGSKGSLQAPWLAQRFTEFLLHNRPLPEEVDLKLRMPPHAARN